MVSRPMTPEWEAEIVEGLKSTMRIIDIATKHCIGKRRVMEIRDRHGLKNMRKHGREKPQYRAMTEEWEKAIVEDLRNNMRITDITVKHHIGYDRVADIQTRYGLFRHKGRRAVQDEMEFYDRFPALWDEARFRILNHYSKGEKKGWLDLREIQKAIAKGKRVAL